MTRINLHHLFLYATNSPILADHVTRYAQSWAVKINDVLIFHCLYDQTGRVYVEQSMLLILILINIVNYTLPFSIFSGKTITNNRFFPIIVLTDFVPTFL